MNVRQIEAFRAVMETGSVTRAGEVLHISQPAVSKLLRAFEGSCGFALFSRSGGRLVPTAEARVLAREVERVFSGADRIAVVAQALKERRWGQITIGALPAVALRLLPRVLAPYLAERSEVRLALHARTSPRVIDLVATQQVDLGLSLLPSEHPHVTVERLARFHMVCILPKGHALARLSKIEPADLHEQPFIALGREDRSRFVIDEAFHGEAIGRQVQIEAQLAESACAFVAAGMGISIVPPFTAADFGERLIDIRPFHPPIAMDVWLLLPTGREPSMLTLDVVDLLRGAFEPYDAQD